VIVSLNQPILVVETSSVFFEVGSECVSVIYMSFGHQGVKKDECGVALGLEEFQNLGRKKKQGCES
jgi:hypothetical protein